MELPESEPKQSARKKLWGFAKLTIAFAILYAVIRQSDTEKLTFYTLNMSPVMLICAFLAFTGAQFFSVLRMNLYYRHKDRPISFTYSLRLYYVGLFYNVILPGGIGGDGYKVYLLRKKAGFPVKEGIKIQIAARLNGMLVLGITGCLLFLFLPTPLLPMQRLLLIAAALILGTILYVLLVHFLLKEIAAIELQALPYSFVIQGLNMLCVVFLWLGLSGAQGLVATLLLFQIAAVAGMIPISIGGLGLREMTFFYGSAVLNDWTGSTLDGELGITLSLLVFFITLLSAMIGVRWIHSITQMNPCDEKKSTLDSPAS